MADIHPLTVVISLIYGRLIGYNPPNRTPEVLFCRCDLPYISEMAADEPGNLPYISEIGALKLCGVSDSGDSDTHRLVFGV